MYPDRALRHRRDHECGCPCAGLDVAAPPAMSFWNNPWVAAAATPAASVAFLLCSGFSAQSRLGHQFRRPLTNRLRVVRRVVGCRLHEISSAADSACGGRPGSRRGRTGSRFAAECGLVVSGAIQGDTERCRRTRSDAKDTYSRSAISLKL